MQACNGSWICSTGNVEKPIVKESIDAVTGTVGLDECPFVGQVEARHSTALRSSPEFEVRFSRIEPGGRPFAGRAV